MFLTPCFPNQQGNGLARRAFSWLQVLSERYAEVQLLVIPVAAGREFRIPPETVAKCVRYTIIRPSVVDYLYNRVSLFRPTRRPHFWLSARIQQKVEAYIKSASPELILVHRFYLTSCITTLLETPNRSIPILLDLDDIESESRDQLASLYRLRGKHRQAKAMQQSAISYRQFEEQYLCSYDQVITCSAEDASRLAARFPQLSLSCHVPQTTDDVELNVKSANGIFRFLFIGNFDYPPNRDAVEFLLDDILPLLQARSRTRFEILLVGSGILPRRVRHRLPPEIRYIGAVPEATPWYQQADAVLAPVRFGGGTSLKVLEAFAFARPLVATHCAVRGVSVTDEVDVLLADNAVLFATQCCRLIDDSMLRSELVRNARTLYSSNYSISMFRNRATQALQLPGNPVRANDHRR